MLARSERVHRPAYHRLVTILTTRETISRLSSLWFFVVASLVCLIAFVYGSGFQNSFVTESVLITTDPLLLLNIVVIVFVGLVLGLRLSTSIAWEREHRTVEVLLVGPASWSMIVLSKFLVELVVLASLVAIYLAYLAVAQPLGAGVIDPAALLAALYTPAYVLPLMATGLLVSSVMSTVRGAVILYLVVVIALAAFDGVLAVLQATPPEEMSLTSLYLKAGFEAVAPILAPLSPTAHIAGMIRTSYAQSGLAIGDLLVVLALTAGLLLAAWAAARWKGSQ